MCICSYFLRASNNGWEIVERRWKCATCRCVHSHSRLTQWYVLCGVYIYRHIESYEWSNAQLHWYGVSRETVSHKRIPLAVCQHYTMLWHFDIHAIQSYRYFIFCLGCLFFLYFSFFPMLVFVPFTLWTNVPSFSHDWYTYRTWIVSLCSLFCLLLIFDWKPFCIDYNCELVE